MLKFYAISFLIIVIDQLTKYYTVQNIPLHETVRFIPGVLSLTYIQNTGAAFSILEGQMWFFYIVTILVVAFVIYYLQTQARGEPLFGVALSFVLGGAIGNFIDRLINQYVVDMFKLEFINFAIFNVADAALNIGIILLFIFIIFADDEQLEGL